MPFPLFDRDRLKIESLALRQHDLTLNDIRPLAAVQTDYRNPRIPVIASRILAARERGAAVVLIMGAHVLRRGNQRFLIDLLERGLITHIAMNGAGAIHDFEWSLIGATTESVARYIRTGQFGMWRETGMLNEVARQAHRRGLGYGEAVGEAIESGLTLPDGTLVEFPHRSISVFAAGYRLRVPITVHVCIGQDIIHQHPSFDGAAAGAASYTDFLIFAQSILGLEGGVLLNMGSAVMGPEVYLKALSMARNVARQEGREIAHFTTAVFDLPDLGEEFEAEPARTDPRYYYRPWKTILVRTVADGGESFYVQGDHGQTVPALWSALTGHL